jgi:rfaE bifunctional protein kinase chain/domain
MNPQRARELVARFAGLRVVVVGDVMLDRFIVGHVTRISPEAPVPVVRFQSEHVRLGGAANVANNIAALGGRAALVGVVGTDRAAAHVREQLTAANIPHDGLVEDPQRPTTEKVRVVTERNQQVARIDYERDADAGGDVERAIVARVARLGAGARALLASDYLKGSITRAVVEALLRRTGTPLIVDPKIPHLACYAGATLITPNHHEAEAVTLASARRSAFSALARQRPTTILEDVTVPRSELATMVGFIATTAAEHGLQIGTFGHMGDGNLHPTFLTDERDEDEMKRVHLALDAIVTKTLALGGTITGEHGVGADKAASMPKMFAPEDLDAMQRVRLAIDPRNLCNPGKIFPLSKGCGEIRIRKQSTHPASAS